MNHTNAYRKTVLRKIAGDRTFKKMGPVTYEIEGKRFHIKVKTGQLKKYPFNINDTVLTADYEVYVCGTDALYYMVPIDLVKTMHADPAAMPDYRNPGYTIIDIYPDEEQIIYGTGGKSLNVSKYRNAAL